MKLVQFADGTFGVRKFSIVYMSWVYRDLCQTQFWWPATSGYFADCKGSYEKASSLAPDLKVNS